MLNEMNAPLNVNVYVRSDQNLDGIKTYKTYKTDAGIPFECVEFVRRYFMQTRGLTFPSVVDATDMFYRIHALIPTQTTQSNQSVELQTRVYPYVRNALHYLRPGTMLFWAPKPTDELKYGHVAIIVEADAEHVVVAQQNRSPPIQVHDTRELFGAINSPNSEYLGLKMVS
jgi:CHAP domain